MELRWQDPPPRPQRSSRELAEIAAALREHPGRWALIRTAPKATSTGVLVRRMKTGGLVAFNPPGAYEARSHGADVYARYVGLPEATDTPEDIAS